MSEREISNTPRSVFHDEYKRGYDTWSEGKEIYMGSYTRQDLKYIRVRVVHVDSRERGAVCSLQRSVPRLIPDKRDCHL